MLKAILTISALTILAMATIINAQGNGTTTKGVSAKKTGVSSKPAPGKSTTAAKTAATTAPAQAVINFLQWYGEEGNNVMSIPLVTSYDDAVDSLNNVIDSTKFYTVNFNGTEQYLKKLYSSGYVSEAYLNSQRKYFKEADNFFQEEHMYDGAPDYFDFD
ncbi:MAG: hypothetical protein EOO88_59395, partial [Pedobacter sp.]